MSSGGRATPSGARDGGPAGLPSRPPHPVPPATWRPAMSRAERSAGGTGRPTADGPAAEGGRVPAAGNGATRPDLPPEGSAAGADRPAAGPAAAGPAAAGPAAERGGASGRSGGAAGSERGSPAWWFRRQLVLAGVAGAVVLLAVAGAGVALDQGRDAAVATLRPTADGRGVTAVSPAAEWSRTATWVVGVAVVAVAAVLALLLDHAYRVARFAVLARPGRADPEEAAAEAAQEEPRAWP